MFLQTAGIPDNVSYLVLGMAILLGSVGGWLASYWWRLRNLRQNLDLLQKMESDD